MVNIQHLIDDAKCFETVRDLRWGDGIFCPHCHSDLIIKRGFDETQPHRNATVVEVVLGALTI